MLATTPVLAVTKKVNSKAHNERMERQGKEDNPMQVRLPANLYQNKERASSVTAEVPLNDHSLKSDTP